MPAVGLRLRLLHPPLPMPTSRRSLRMPRPPLPVFPREVRPPRPSSSRPCRRDPAKHLRTKAPAAVVFNLFKSPRGRPSKAYLAATVAAIATGEIDDVPVKGKGKSRAAFRAPLAIPARELRSRATPATGATWRRSQRSQRRHSRLKRKCSPRASSSAITPTLSELPR